MADFYIGRVYPNAPSSWQFLPWCDNPNPGIDFENNVGNFVYLMSQRDPRGFMDTFRYATYFLADPSIRYNAHSASHYYDLWRDINPDPFTIITHHPGTWNASAIWAHTIRHEVTAVEGADDGLQGVVVSGQNPVEREVEIRFSAREVGGGVVEIFDVAGRLVHVEPWKLSTSRFGLMRIDLVELPSGIYFLRVRPSRGEPLGAARKMVLIR